MNEAELERIRELTAVGAGEAASAFSQLAGAEIAMRPPRLTRGSEAEGKALASFDSGVFFELEGCLDAAIGVLFSQASRDAVVRRVLGEPEGHLPQESIEAVLMELGNILVSRVASGIADTLSERLLPSIPVLALDEAGPEFVAFCEGRGGDVGARVECELSDASDALASLLVLVPGRRPSS